MPATVTILVQQSSSGSAVADAKKDLADIGGAAKDAGGGFSIMGEIATGALRAIGEAAVNAVAGGLKALGGAVMDGIADARENAKIQAQTAAVIKSTGNAAGVTAKQVADYASSLSAAAGKSLFGDDQIQQSENLLMTFTNIKGAALESATAMSVDLAQAMGGAPKDSAIQLGKALNDPIKGITALTRIGVTFTDEQKDMIKALQEGGDMAGAQAVILEELNKEFGGSAEAAAKADGGMAQFKDRIGEAKEAIGTALLPLLNQLAGFLNDTVAPVIENVIVPAFGKLVEIIGAFASRVVGAWNDASNAGLGIIESIGYIIDKFLGLGDVIGPVEGAIRFVQDALSGLAATFSDANTPAEGLLNTLSSISPMFAVLRGIVEAALPPIQAIVMSVFGIISGFIEEHGAKIQSDLTAAWTAIQGLIAALLPPIQAIVTAVFGAIATFLAAHGEEIKLFLGQTWDTVAQIVILAVQLIQAIIVPIFTAIAAFLQTHGTEIQTILGGAWTMITSIITGALELIKGIITAVLLAIKGDWAGAWEAIKTMCANVVLAILGVIRGFLTIAETLFSEAWQKILSDATASFNAIKALFIFVWTEIKVFFQGILDGMVGWVLQTLQGIINAISSFAGQAQSAAGRVGDAIVSGIASGIESGASAIINAAKDAAMDALNAAKSALGIGSPSKLFASEIGKPMAQGMAVGLASGAPLVAGAASYAAGAALEGGSSVADSYNRSVTMNVTNNLSGTEGMDYSLAASLAGV